MRVNIFLMALIAAITMAKTGHGVDQVWQAFERGHHHITARLHHLNHLKSE